jgi:uncharacterized DUF497 family protein
LKLSPDSSLDEWLGAFTGAAGEFDWDAANRSKGQKHGVEPTEVESRRLALIFTRRSDQLRPISCRPMRRNERRLYDEAKARLEGGSEEGG